MPIFDMRCEQCGERQSDVWLKMGDGVDKYPQHCGQPMVKEYGATAAHFKGAGFHAVDYRAPTRG